MAQQSQERPPGAMTPDELKAAFSELELDFQRRGDARDRALLMGVTEAAVNHWLRGDTRIPKWVVVWLAMYRLLKQEPRLLEEFRRLRLRRQN